MASKSISVTNVSLMLCLTFFWGSAYVVAKEILRDGLTPVAIATFRFLLAGILFLPVLLFNKTRNREYRLFIERRDAAVVLLLALTGVTFYFIIQYTGIKMAGASIASIMVSLLSPIVISLFSAKVLRERLTRKQVLGIGIASTGTATVVAGTTLSLGNDSNFLIGSLILLLTPFLWATYTIAGKRILERYDPLLVVAYVNIFGALCLIPFSLAENSFQEIFSLTMNEWLGILYLGSICSLLGYLIWFYVLKQISATVTSSFMFAQPLITVLLATAFLNEELTLPVMVGGLLIFIGVYLVGRKLTRLNFFV
jgi:drug/metabolite transporter (DMT)-like permease